jgi:predicted N-acetyltransferase YhbS
MAVEIRGCRPSEWDAVVALTNRVFRPGGGDMRAEYPLLFGAENREGLRIAVEDGQPVAHVGVCVRDALLLGARLRVASIGAVGTEPAFRGRGLASALMADARRYARQCGASLLLISGGRGLYHRLGYVTVGRFERYQLTAEQIGTGTTPTMELSTHEASDLPALAAVHQTETVRFLRSPADWRALLQTGRLMNRPAELLLVRQSGQPVAYLGIQKSDAETVQTGSCVRIQELAGARMAIVAAMPALLRRYRANGVTFVVPPTDVEMSAIARDRAWTPTAQAFPGTLGVIDPPGLLDALRPILAERAEAVAEMTVTAGDETVTFAWRGQEYEVGAPGPLAALLFGGETEEARALPACPAELGALFRSLFPLPLLWPGYNYV